jgi:hypothetical protein
MAVVVETRVGRDIGLSVSELTGALGDSVTGFPLVVALAALTEASLVHLLAGFAVFQVVWGVRYGLPLSVEPMKALAGLAIAGTLAYGELVAAGLLAGGVLLVAGRFGLLGIIDRHVGTPVVRGVQLAVALLLLEAAWDSRPSVSRWPPAPRSSTGGSGRSPSSARASCSRSPGEVCPPSRCPPSRSSPPARRR